MARKDSFQPPAEDGKARVIPSNPLAWISMIFRPNGTSPLRAGNQPITQTRPGVAGTPRDLIPW